MRAIILAAGIGKRLVAAGADRLPKCLLEFGGKTLLERHLEALQHYGVTDVVLTLGYRAEQVEARLAGLEALPRPAICFNPRFTEGSVVSLWSVREYLADGDTILMDADVLYDHRVLGRLVETAHANSLLMDRLFEPGAEPVKICVRDGAPVEFRKEVAPGLVFDAVGESVGFFKFSAPMARALATRVEAYEEDGRHDAPHEEAIRDLLVERPAAFGVEDVTGLPWIEIDFAEDVRRAEADVLPRLSSLAG